MNDSKRRDVRAWIKVAIAGGVGGCGVRFGRIVIRSCDRFGVYHVDAFGAQMLHDQNLPIQMWVGDAPLPYNRLAELP